MKREPIPWPVRRQLRQEAGFGCCKCGFPIFQYHHIARHSRKLEDLMILCPTHHHEATVGAMLDDEQRCHKAHPYNIARGYIDGTLKIVQTSLAATFGSNQFVGDGSFIFVDQISLLSLGLDGFGRLELTVRVCDSNDQLLVAIRRNEWIAGDPLPWDLESGFQWILARRKKGDIVLEIDARNFPVEIRADLWLKRQNFKLSPDWIMFNGIVQNVGFKNLCFVAMWLVADTSGGRFMIQPDPRFGSGLVVSEPDAQERVRQGITAYERLTGRGA